MGSLSHLYSGMYGFAAAYQMHAPKKNEDTVKAGRNYYLTAIWQQPQALLSTIELFLTIPSKGIIAIPLFLGSVITSVAISCIPHIAAGYLSRHYERPVALCNRVSAFLRLPGSFQLNTNYTPKKERIYRFISQHSGNISQGIFAIATVAQFALGFHVAATTAIVVMGISYVDRKGYLPEQISIIYNESLGPLMALISIFTGNPIQKIAGVINFLSSVKSLQHRFDRWTQTKMAGIGIHYPRLCDVEANASPARSLAVSQFTIEEIEAFDPGIELEIDPTHAQRRLHLPDTTGIEFPFLNDLANKLFTAEKLPGIPNLLVKDDRWKHASADPEVPLNYLQYLKDQTKMFVLYMNGDAQPVGGLSTMDDIRSRCKVIVKYMQQLDIQSTNMAVNPKKRIAAEAELQTLLLNIAVNGGNYCVQGLNDCVKEGLDQAILNIQTAGYVATDDNPAIHQALTNRLDAMTTRARERWFQAIYAKISKIMANTSQAMSGVDGGLGIEQDRHTANESRRFIASGLGIDINAAQKDKTVEGSPIIEKTLPILFPFLRYAMWTRPTPITPEDTYIYQNGRPQYIPQPGLLNQLKGRISYAKAWIEYGYKIAFILLRAQLHQQESQNLRYNQKTLIEEFNALFGIGRSITPTDYRAWWGTYLEKIGIDNDDPRYAQIIHEVVDIQRDHQNEERFKASEKYLKIMLIQMGFFKKPLLV